MISTRGRYALRVIIDLAEHRNENYIPMKEIAKRQEISLKYLERIVPLLTKENLIQGIHGKGGGYKLTREPRQYTVGDILRAAEKTLAPVSCLECNAKACPRAAECKTLPMWKKFNNMINDFFDGITIADLTEKDDALNFVI